MEIDDSMDFSCVNFERLATDKNYLNGGAGGAVHGPVTLYHNEYAIKKVLLGEDQHDSMTEKIETKANIWKSLKNRNLIRILLVRLCPNVLFILMEYAGGGSLSSTLRDIRCTRSKLPVNVVSDWSKQIADGMLYLHNNKLVHRDIKPGNSEYYRCTVNDFLV